MAVAALIERAVWSSDPDSRKALFRRVDELLTDLQPGTFLFQKDAINVMSRRITPGRPFSISVDGNYRLQYASIRQK